MIYSEKKIFKVKGPQKHNWDVGQFYYQSCLNLLDELTTGPSKKTKTDVDDADNNFISNIIECFVYSHQTNLEDLTKCELYEKLEFVEFLEFICRVAISYGKD